MANNTLELFKQAVDYFGERVQAIEPDEWDKPTPCSDWTVRDLLNHMANEMAWVPDMLAGKTIEQVGSKYDGDLLGNDPIGRWQLLADQAVMALSPDGALDRTVHLSAGDATAKVYAGQLTSDLSVHGWDLAKAIGANTRIDPELLAITEQSLAPIMEGARAGGYFATPVSVADDADQQTKLLAALGRTA